MKSKRRPIWLTAAIAALIVLFWALSVIADPEKRNLDPAARAATPGAFALLSDGYTHYELGGPASGDGRAVVLAAGFSVPYYIWDPTFNALTSAGFRVLRYDYYGRGYSDRPSIPFNDDMYVRQLDELLKSLGITGPVDLTGISFGGSFITSFADKYPNRVRSLIYFDPSIRRPYPLSLLEHMPQVWGYLTVLLDERFWAGFPSSRTVSRLAETLSGTNAVQRVSQVTPSGNQKQCRCRPERSVQARRRAPAPGACHLGKTR